MITKRKYLSEFGKNLRKSKILLPKPAYSVLLHCKFKGKYGGNCRLLSPSAGHLTKRTTHKIHHGTSLSITTTFMSRSMNYFIQILEILTIVHIIQLKVSCGEEGCERRS